VHEHNRPHHWEEYQLSVTALSDEGLCGDYFQVPPNRYQSSKVYRPWPPHFEPLKGAIQIPPGQLTKANCYDSPTYGFSVHDHCWTLIERVIGKDCGEQKNLHLLLRALLRRWRERTLPFPIPATFSLRNMDVCMYVWRRMERW
jgi:hypothetical protein